MNKSAQLSVRTDYDYTFRVRAAQLFNVLQSELQSIEILDSFKVGLEDLMKQYPDTPHVQGIHYTPMNNNSLLSWRSMHSMRLTCARHAELTKTYQIRT